MLMNRSANGTGCAVPSMGKGMGNEINAHIDYVAEVERLIDAG